MRSHHAWFACLVIVLAGASSVAATDAAWQPILDATAAARWQTLPEVADADLAALRGTVAEWCDGVTPGQEPWPCSAVHRIPQNDGLAPQGLAAGDRLYAIDGAPLGTPFDYWGRKPDAAQHRLRWRRGARLREDDIIGPIGGAVPMEWAPVRGYDWTPVVLAVAAGRPPAEDLVAAAMALSDPFGRHAFAAVRLLEALDRADAHGPLPDLLHATAAAQSGDRVRALHHAVRVLAARDALPAVRTHAGEIAWLSAALLSDVAAAQALLAAGIAPADPALAALAEAPPRTWDVFAADALEREASGSLLRWALSTSASYVGTLLDEKPFRFGSIKRYGNGDAILLHPAMPGVEGFRLSLRYQVTWRAKEGGADAPLVFIGLRPSLRAQGNLSHLPMMSHHAMLLQCYRDGLATLLIEGRLLQSFRFAPHAAKTESHRIEIDWWQGILRIRADGRLLAAAPLPASALPGSPRDCTWSLAVSSGSTDEATTTDVRWDALGAAPAGPFHVHPDVAPVLAAVINGDVAAARAAWAPVAPALTQAGYAAEAVCMPAYFDRAQAYLDGKAIDLPLTTRDLWLHHNGDFHWTEGPNPVLMVGLRAGECAMSYPLPFHDGEISLTYRNLNPQRRLPKVGVALETTIKADTLRRPAALPVALFLRPPRLSAVGVEKLPVPEMPLAGTLAITRHEGLVDLAFDGTTIATDVPALSCYRGWMGLHVVGSWMARAALISRVQVRRTPLAAERLTALRAAGWERAAAMVAREQGGAATPPAAADF